METSATICNTLHHALENRDLDEIMSLYADDAELRVVDRNHTPSNPLELRGKSAIGDYLSDIFSRDMTHSVGDEVIGDDRIAFSEQCRYPDGTRVFTNATIELRNGKIVRETEVQAWDETH